MAPDLAPDLAPGPPSPPALRGFQGGGVGGWPLGPPTIRTPPALRGLFSMGGVEGWPFGPPPRRADFVPKLPTKNKGEQAPP